MHWRHPLSVAFALLGASIVPLPTGTPDVALCNTDKLLHAAGHAWLTAAIAETVDDTHYRSMMLGIVLSVGFGVITEILQKLIPGRLFEADDILAGFAGSLAGAGCWSYTILRKTPRASARGECQLQLLSLSLQR
jgi:VanZ family protein